LVECTTHRCGQQQRLLVAVLTLTLVLTLVLMLLTLVPTVSVVALVRMEPLKMLKAGVEE
jgi:hypothetical protein